jgi:FkbM family methyltransferase
MQTTDVDEAEKNNDQKPDFLTRRWRPLLSFFSLLAIGETILFFGFFHPRIAFSVKVLTQKVRGDIPYVSWGDVAALAVPKGMRPFGRVIYHPEPLLTIPINLKEQGAGPCATNWETPLGSFWTMSTERDLLAYLVHEQTVLKIYDQQQVSIRPGDIVIDGGAHIGTFVRYALSKKAKLVVAVEPDPRNLSCLKKTFESEIREGKVIVAEAALWDQPGKLQFSLSGENTARSSAINRRGEVQNVQVEAITMDSLIARYQLASVDFVKLDIEGAERNALRGAKDMLRRFGPRMALCTYHRGDDAVVITETVLRIRPEYQVFAANQQAYFY